MDAAIGVVGVPLLIIFTILNLVLYHKVFTVYYFNLGTGLGKELMWSMFFAVIEAAIVITIGVYVIPIVAIVAIVLFIKKKNNKDHSESSGNMSEGTEYQSEVPTNATTTYRDDKANSPISDVKQNATTQAIDSLSQGSVNNQMVPSNNEQGWFCPRCGNKAGLSHKFCVMCGTPRPKTVYTSSI